MNDAAMVQIEARVATQPRDGGPGLTSPLQGLYVRPIPIKVAKELLVREHYLHAIPGGTQLGLGVFLGHRLLGAVTLGVGPFNAYRLVEEASPHDCLTLSRLWLSEELPKNSESRVIGTVLRSIKKHTSIKFLITYADPSRGHLGTIYQATNWLYTGMSEPMPLYDLGDGTLRHSRSVAHAYGTHSVKYLQVHGVDIKVVPQSAKYRYLYFLDPAWKRRLLCNVLPYPKMEAVNGDHRPCHSTNSRGAVEPELIG